MADPHTLLYDGNKFHLVMKLSAAALCGLGREKMMPLPVREHTDNLSEPEFIEWTVTCTKCAKGAQQIWQGNLEAPAEPKDST